MDKPIYKMYCIFAKESIKKMNGNRGKLATQAGHAYLHAYWDAIGKSTIKGIRHKVKFLKYEQADLYQQSERAYKITLVVDTVDELTKLHQKYKSICGTSLVTDAGITVFDGPTTTCLGIGPIADYNIGEDLKALKVLI